MVLYVEKRRECKYFYPMLKITSIKKAINSVPNKPVLYDIQTSMVPKRPLAVKCSIKKKKIII